MKTMLLALMLASLAPLAQAQPVNRPPGPAFGHRAEVPRGEPQDYWRRSRDGDHDREWRRQAEFREQEHRRAEWRRGHCVRDWRGETYCRE